jgi:hypothetical protein
VGKKMEATKSTVDAHEMPYYAEFVEITLRFSRKKFLVSGSGQYEILEYLCNLGPLVTAASCDPGRLPTGI